MKNSAIIALCSILMLAQPSIAEEEHGHEEHGNEEGEHKEVGEEEGGHDDAPETIELSAKSIAIGGIEVNELIAQLLRSEIDAPGEIKLNTYLSSKVSTQIAAQVVERHAILGDGVSKDQPLVTLSSVELARAVGDLLVADKEWARVKRLGSSVVSEKRRSEAQIAREQALAIAKAYGVPPAHLEETLAAGIDANPGQFQLLAQQDGVIASDEFIVGELIEPGRVMFDLIDESVLWVESNLSPDTANGIKVGDQARVRGVDGTWLAASVIQKHHMLDPETRTIGVRMQVNNDLDRLHAGMYVEAKIQSGGTDMSIAVPSTAVLRSPDGDWIVFVEEEPGHFKPVEVEVIRTVGNLTVISGLPEGTRVVTKGAFFVQSELAKSGFSVHNH